VIKHRVLHFFCKHGDPETSTAAAIVANLIDQLVTQCPLKPLVTALNEARRRYANSTYCIDFNTLWTIFLDIISKFPTRIIVFVDALDECTENRSTFMEAFTTLPKEIDVRFCVTSRDVPHIKRALEKHLHDGRVLKVKMQPDKDIREYLQDCVEKHQELHPYREEILEKVTHHADGMFRYAVLLIDELLSSPMISAKLESPPAGLSQMYENILFRLHTDPLRNKPQHQRHRKQILQWVCVAKRPLTAEELAWSCVADETSLDPKSCNIQSQKLMELCSPLLEILDGRVYFTHKSAKEFLLRKPADLYTQDSNIKSQISTYLVDSTHAHLSIATIGSM